MNMTKSWLSVLLSGVVALSTITPLTVVAQTPVYDLSVGEPLAQSAVITLPELNKEAEGLKVNWTISDTQIAKMNYKKELVGLKEGTVHVKASVDGHPDVYTEFEANIHSTVTGVAFAEKDVDMLMGQTVPIKAQVLPETAYDQNVKYSTSNRNVATVQSNGTIKAVGVGEATITAKTEDGGYTDTMHVNVTSPVNELALGEETLVVNVGESQQIPILLDSSTTDTQTILYTASDRSIVSISTKGVLKGLSEGESDVLLKTKDGLHEVTLHAVVVSDVNDIVALQEDGSLVENVTMYVGTSKKFTVTNDAENPKALSEYKTVFTSSDPDVVKVMYGGSLKAVAEGTATITVTLPQESTPVSYSFDVSVSPSIEEIVLDKTKLSLAVGGKETVKATVLPETAPNKTVTWKSENTKVATVFNGTVKGVGAGTTTVTASSSDGTVVAICEVTVESLAEGIQAPDTVILHVGEVQSFTPAVLPETALNKVLGFKLAKEDATGLKVSKSYTGKITLTGLKEGTYALDLYSYDGNHHKTVSVQVIPTSIQIILQPVGTK